MEEFVSDLLHNADLTVLTKKHVRLKYKEHVGKDLSTEEKEKINNLVYAFVSDYAAKQRNSDSSPPSSSPGNKENQEAKGKKIILKGHVIDKEELTRGKPVKQSPKPARKQYTPIKTYPRRVRTPRMEFQDVMTAVLDSDNKDDNSDESDSERKRDTSQSDSSDSEVTGDFTEALARLKEGRDKKIQMSQEKKQKFAQKRQVEKGSALKSLFQNEKIESLKQNSDDSSVILISEGETVDKTGESPKPRTKLTPMADTGQINSTLAYSGIKINMSSTGKMNSKSESVKMDKIDNRNEGASKAKHKKNDEYSEKQGPRTDSESEPLKVKKTPETYVVKKRKTSSFNKTPEKSLSKLDSGSEPLKFNKTPETYEGKKLKKIREKKKVKLKRKRKLLSSSSDSDSDMDIPLAKRRKTLIKVNTDGTDNVKRKQDNSESYKDNKTSDRKTNATRKRTEFTVESDSGSSHDDRPGEKISSTLGKKTTKTNGLNSVSSTGKTPQKQSIKSVRSDSESSRWNTPPVKKYNESKRKAVKIVESDSESSTGDTPLAKKLNLSKKDSVIIISTDAESSTVEKSNTSRQKAVKTVESDSESSTADTPHIKKNNPSRQNAVKTVESDSESSTADTPLVKKSNTSRQKAVKSVESDSESSTADTPLVKKSNTSRQKAVKAVESDSESSTGDTPLVKKSNTSRQKAVKTVESDSESSTGDTPLVKKSNTSRQKTVKTVESDSESSTVDTPLVKKSNISRQKAVKTVESDTEYSTADTPLVKKSNISRQKAVKTVESDSEYSTADTPLVKKSNTSRQKAVKSVESDSESSTADTPLVKKSNTSRQKAVKTVDSDSESGTGDTPLVKRLNLSKKDSVIVISTDAETSTVESPRSKKSLYSNTMYSSIISESDDNLVIDQGTDSEADVTLQASGAAPDQLERSSTRNSRESTPVKQTKREKKTTHGSAIETSPLKEEKKAPVKSRSAQMSQVQNDSESSDDSEDLPLSKLNQSAENKTQVLISESSSSSSEDDVPLAISAKAEKSKKVQKQKTASKKSSESGKESSHLKQLRKICRACGMFILNTRELKHCNTEKQKINKLKELLQEAGMKGQPSMKKAEEIRLKKEAAQLDEGNIISAEAGRGKRKVRSKYSRHKPSPKKSPKKSPEKLMKNVFLGLQDIVDSEGSDSD